MKQKRLSEWQRVRYVQRQPLGDWVMRALCAEHPEVDFDPHPYTHRRTAPARRICRQCPVRTECLNHALTNHEWFGIWGGHTPQERFIMQGART